MKKIFKGIVLLLFGIMMFTLIGCTSNQKTGEKKESTPLVKEIKTDELKEKYNIQGMGSSRHKIQ